jgi:hypothetical protein
MPSLPTPSHLVRHVYQALCLVVLMIAGQQGAVVHELGHLTGVQGVDLRAGAGEGSDATCALCPAFAQVATPAFSHSFYLPSLLRVEIARLAELRVATVEASVPTPRSRGPPSQS